MESNPGGVSKYPGPAHIPRRQLPTGLRSDKLDRAVRGSGLTVEAAACFTAKASDWRVRHGDWYESGDAIREIDVLASRRLVWRDSTGVERDAGLEVFKNAAFSLLPGCVHASRRDGYSPVVARTATDGSIACTRAGCVVSGPQSEIVHAISLLGLEQQFAFGDEVAERLESPPERAFMEDRFGPGRI